MGIINLLGSLNFGGHSILEAIDFWGSKFVGVQKLWGVKHFLGIIQLWELLIFKGLTI